MSQNRLRRLISQYFPEKDYEEILTILESRGKDRSITRDSNDFATLIEISEGDVSVLEHYAQTATDDELEVFRSWLSAKVDYVNGPHEHISFFTEAVIPLAKLAVKLKLTFRRSLGSILLFDKQQPQRFFYIVPTLDRRIFVTKDREAISSGKVSSNLTPYEGHFLSCEEVADFIAREWDDG